MKYFIGMCFLFVSAIVYPQTVINYDDGSTYTLQDYEKIYTWGVPLRSQYKSIV